MLLNAANVVTAAERRDITNHETGRIPIQSLLSSDDFDKQLKGEMQQVADTTGSSVSILGKRKLANTPRAERTHTASVSSGKGSSRGVHRSDSNDTDLASSDWASGLSEEDGDVAMRDQHHDQSYDRDSARSAKERSRRGGRRRKGRSATSRGSLRDSGISFTSQCSSMTEYDSERQAKSGKTNRRHGAVRSAPRRRWKEHEDELLLKVVGEHGPGRWNSLAEQFPGRNGRQVRLRWMNHLQPSLDKREWRPEEDKILLDQHKALGNKWALIAMRLNGRTDNSVKNRYKSLMRRAQREAKGRQHQRH